MMIRERTREVIQVLQYVLAVIILIALGIFVSQNWEEFGIIFTVSLSDVLILLGALLLYNLAAAGRFASIYRSLGANLGIVESFGLSTVASALNLLLPARPGAIARALYLKRRHNIPLSQAPTILFGSLLFSIFIGGIAILGINLLALYNGIIIPEVMWLVGLVASSSVFLLWFTLPQHFTSRLGRIGNWLQLFSEGWGKLKSDKKAFSWTVFFQILEMLLAGLSILISYRILGSSMSYFVSVSIAIFSSFVNFINITPGNVGLLEIMFGYLTELTGGTFVEGVSAGTVLHLGGYILIFGIAPIAWYFLFHRQNIQVRAKDTE